MVGLLADRPLLQLLVKRRDEHTHNSDRLPGRRTIGVLDQETWDRQKRASLAKAKAEGKEPWQMLAFGKNADDRIAAHGPMRNTDDSQCTFDL